MKKARIPLMLQDPSTAPKKLTEGYDPEREFFLDGPISDRVAVIDFDPDTGALHPGVRFNRGRVRGYYEDAQGKNIYQSKKDPPLTPEFMQVNVFATVLRTMDQFEKKDTLGRPLVWAFDGPQLLLIPRAGLKANAFYERDSRSLQFFFFESSNNPGEMIYSCLSRDIVAHEAAHAIIDGIAPDLMDAYTPQSLAIHESLADIVALLVSMSSHTLIERTLKTMRGSIAKPTLFTNIAEEFGKARGHGYGLRDFFNQKSLNPDDAENFVDSTEPHELSEVLSGALYQVLIKMHEASKDQYVEKPEYKERGRSRRYHASFPALADATRRFKEMVFRGLDYMPPGEISYADLGRGIIAAHRIDYPADEHVRDWLREAFLERHIIQDINSLDVDADFGHAALQDISVAELHQSDWAAYEFARTPQGRELLRIPPEISFKVNSRLEVRKTSRAGVRCRECLFKVSWSETEDNDVGDVGLPWQRRVVVGTTLVLDWYTGQVKARLTSAPPNNLYEDESSPAFRLQQIEHEQQYQARNNFVRFLADEDLLDVSTTPLGSDDQTPRSAIYGEVVDDVLRVRGTANMLHMVGG